MQGDLVRQVEVGVLPAVLHLADHVAGETFELQEPVIRVSRATCVPLSHRPGSPRSMELTVMSSRTRNAFKRNPGIGVRSIDRFRFLARAR